MVFSVEIFNCSIINNEGYYIFYSRNKGSFNIRNCYIKENIYNTTLYNTRCIITDEFEIFELKINHLTTYQCQSQFDVSISLAYLDILNDPIIQSIDSSLSVMLTTAYIYRNQTIKIISYIDNESENSHEFSEYFPIYKRRFNYQYTVPNNLAIGEHILYLKAFDQEGNETNTVSCKFIYRSPPIFSITTSYHIEQSLTLIGNISNIGYDSIQFINASIDDSGIISKSIKYIYNHDDLNPYLELVIPLPENPQKGKHHVNIIAINPINRVIANQKWEFDYMGSNKKINSLDFCIPYSFRRRN